jgi:preprotein translocase subunit Sec61beta
LRLCDPSRSLRETNSTYLLKFLDILLTLAHFVLIGFNLFGWIWPKTRKAHLITVAATAFSWFVLGIWFGWGYCPITDWQWKVKEKLGETGLPNSFIKYYADKISGKDIDPKIVDTATLIVFLVVIILTLFLIFFNKRRKRLSKTL